eukprot:9477234-Pyramimonas_sp.AAC.1
MDKSFIFAGRQSAVTEYTPYNLQCPDPPPHQEVVFSHVLMMGACHAGAPAGGSDGSWKQAQSADVTGISPSGITPSDT